MRKSDKPKGPRAVVSNGAIHSNVSNLTPSEMRLIMDFRQLSIEQKSLYADAIEDCAAECRLNEARPALRIVRGGAE